MPASLTYNQLKERFVHRPLVPDDVILRRNKRRQRWGLPPRTPPAASSD